MSKDAAFLRGELTEALEAVGKDGATKYTGNDKTGGMLHEYYVCTEAEGYFKKRREVALDVIKAEFDDGIVSQGSEAVLISSTHYDLILKVSNAPQRFDKALLPKALIDVFGATREQIDAIMELVTKDGSPSRSYRAVPK